MKKILFSMAFIVHALLLYAQAPQAFNYQAILRNPNGTVKSNETVSLQINIVTEEGISVYLETHQTSSNELGLVHVAIGQGITSYNLANVDWSDGPYFVDITVNEEQLGSSPIFSVPYALYAASGNPGPEGPKGPKGEPGDNMWNEVAEGIIFYDGYVGIGTDAPGETLEVNGNLKVTGELLFDGAGEELDITISELLELLNNAGIIPNNYAGNLTDIDGNVYPTIQLGDQIWMGKNLKVTRFADGTPIPSAQILEVCGELTGYYTWYNLMDPMISSDANPSGVQAVCPDGWHLPSMAECNDLISYLGGSDLAGAKMKEAGTRNWNSPNTGATNESGFDALPAGWQDWEFERAIIHSGEGAYFWTATEQDMDNAINLRLFYDSEDISIESLFMALGASVRCVKD